MSEAEINRHLMTALDVESLFSLICKENDADSKHIYFFLFKLLRKSLLRPSATSQLASDMSLATTIDAYIGKPPFEEPSICKAIINFLFNKFCKTGRLPWQRLKKMTYELA